MPENLNTFISRTDFQSSAEYNHCKTLLTELVQACTCEESTLWLLSQDSDSLMGTVNIGKTPDILENIDVLIKDSVIGMVALTATASCISADDEYDRSVDQASKTDTRAMAATPVYLDGEVCGVLSALNPIDRETFNQDDLGILQWKSYLLGLILKSFVDYNQ